MDFWDRVRWDIRRLYYQARKVVLRHRIGEQWEGDGTFEHRRYPDYATYVEHQKTKFSAFRSKSIIRHDQRFHAALTERLAELREELRGRSVLCLAARQGSEVRSFIDQGAFAVGIDLNPGPANRYVVVGDFHELQYADNSVDVVYTNSLDHAFDLDRILSEVRRVLRPHGMLIVEANVGGEGDPALQRGPYEALVWAGADALLQALEERGFEAVSRKQFQIPWPGEHFRLRMSTGQL